jgi:hypothetical protein
MLDHRGEIFIAELGQTFRAPPGFRVFAAQNPLQEGGGRRGLPKSFLNRFTRVHVDLLQPDDLIYIAGTPILPYSPGSAGEIVRWRSREKKRWHMERNCSTCCRRLLCRFPSCDKVHYWETSGWMHADVMIVSTDDTSY